MWNAAFWLCLATATLLIVHKIDSASRQGAGRAVRPRSHWV